MQALDQLQQVAETKRKESVAMAKAYATTLSALGPANFFLVVGAALLSLIAGATILIDQQILSKTLAGILALISGALTIIHSKLGCEQYQAECKKLLSFHRGMAEDYSNLGIIADDSEFRKQLSALNDQLSATIKSSAALPFGWATAKHKDEAHRS